jgi:radical SAM protein with 4Fe4S-binding SPASM domain
VNRNLKDLRNLFQKSLRPSRVANAIKVISSYYVSKILKRPIHWGKPITFSIEPTTSCNLRCPQCPSGLRSFSRPTGMLGMSVFEKAINELHKSSAYVTFYFQGEPYLNTQFLDMVSLASKHKLYSATSTNAHYLDKENAEKTVKSGLDRLIISIDGTTQETYGKYRIGGKLEKVLAGTKELMDAKKRLNSKTPHVIWQFIVFSHNEHQLDEVKSLAKSYNIDELAIKSAQIYDYETGNEMMPKNEEFSRYKNEGNEFKIKNKLLNHCWRLWNSCVITWDGKIVPCCFDKDGTYRLGDLNNMSFEQIWKGPAYHQFRKQIIKGRQYIDICKNCSEGTSVWKN